MSKKSNYLKKSRIFLYTLTLILTLLISMALIMRNPPNYEDTTGYAFGVYVSGDYAYVADGDSGLAVIDISDPTNPGTPVYKDTTGDARGVFVSGDYAYVADGESGLAVIDIPIVYSDQLIAFIIFIIVKYVAKIGLE